MTTFSHQLVDLLNKYERLGTLDILENIQQAVQEEKFKIRRQLFDAQSSTIKKPNKHRDSPSFRNYSPSSPNTSPKNIFKENGQVNDTLNDSIESTPPMPLHSCSRQFLSPIKKKFSQSKKKVHFNSNLMENIREYDPTSESPVAKPTVSDATHSPTFYKIPSMMIQKFYQLPENMGNLYLTTSFSKNDWKCGILMLDENTRKPRCHSNMMEVFFIVSGSCFVETAENSPKEALPAGSVFFIPPKTPYSLESGDEPVTLHFVLFSKSKIIQPQQRVTLEIKDNLKENNPIQQPSMTSKQSPIAKKTYRPPLSQIFASNQLST